MVMLTSMILRAAALLAEPSPCVHDLATPRPQLTRAEQEETKRVIRAVVADLGGSKDFAAVLVLVASRESSLQRGLVHRLPLDLDGSTAAWRHTRGLYEGNQWAADASRWQTYGLFGMNSNYFTQVWDRAADPRVLCDAVVDADRAGINAEREVTTADLGRGPVRERQAAELERLKTVLALGGR